jgi:hypothetical protein
MFVGQPVLVFGNLGWSIRGSSKCLTGILGSQKHSPEVLAACVISTYIRERSVVTFVTYCRPLTIRMKPVGERYATCCSPVFIGVRGLVHILIRFNLRKRRRRRLALNLHTKLWRHGSVGR